MISVDALTVEFSGTSLFSDISFVINESDKIALMGKNGAGKSAAIHGWVHPVDGSGDKLADWVYAEPAVLPKLENRKSRPPDCGTYSFRTKQSQLNLFRLNQISIN